MSIFKRPTGLNQNTAKHLLLDAGAWFKNYDINADYESKKAKCIGATAGGGSFSAVPTIRPVEVDGKRGSVKGFNMLDDWVVTQTANVKEITAASLALALAAANLGRAGDPPGYVKITGKGEIEESDYADNITWIGRLSGSNKPVSIQIFNALATNGLSLTTADKNEGVVAITLTGNYTLDDMETPPFAIYYPIPVENVENPSPNVDAAPASNSAGGQA